ncbi:MAG: hypothetical protein ACR2H4_17730 [Pyrinomonadaceae bacterium]
MPFGKWLNIVKQDGPRDAGEGKKERGEKESMSFAGRKKEKGCASQPLLYSHPL